MALVPASASRNVELYVQHLLASGFVPVDNRSWTNPQSKSEFGCIGLDYVKDAKLLDIRYYWNETHQVLRGTATFPSCCEGPPACAHGASIATVFDEILAHPVWRVRPQAFTVQLNVQYRKMVPLGSTQCFEARVDFDRLLPADLESNDPATARAARQVFVSGELFEPSSSGSVAAVHASGTAIFQVSSKFNRAQLARNQRASVSKL